MVEHAFYALSLLLALSCLVLVDYRYRLAYFIHKRATILTLLVGLIYFGLWDLGGIHYHIFYNGHVQYELHWFIFTNFPIEEILFLLLLGYSSLLIFRGFAKGWKRD